MTDTPETAVALPSDGRSRVAHYFAVRFRELAWFFAALTLLSFLPRLWWPFELMCHFRVQYFWICVALTLLLRRSGDRRALALALGGALVNAAVIAPIYARAQTHPPDPSFFRFITFNVYGENTQYTRVLEYLRTQNANMVLLLEVTPEWEEQLATLEDRYPYQVIESRSDYFGIALLSVDPLQEAEVRIIGSMGAPSIIARTMVSGRPLTVIGTHPPLPLFDSYTGMRNEQLALLAEHAAGTEGPTILAGDLNITEFSPYFGDLLRASGLKDSRQGFGVQASWSAMFPWPIIPIDHVLISPGMEVAYRHIGPALGSDHRPVVVGIAPFFDGTR